MILLDTDACLGFLLGNTKVLELYGNSSEQICVSGISVEELFYAALQSEDPPGNRVTLEKFLLTVTIIHPDLEVLQYAALLRYGCLKRNKRFSYQDILIFSMSKVLGMKLLTTQAGRYSFT